MSEDGIIPSLTFSATKYIFVTYLLIALHLNKYLIIDATKQVRTVKFYTFVCVCTWYLYGPVYFILYNSPTYNTCNY